MKKGALPALVLLAGFLLLTLGPVLTGYDQFHNKSIDMDKSHVPVVRHFAAQLPSIDLSDYNSATTPGLHVFLALITRIFGDSVTLMQVVTCGFGAGLVCLVWWYASRLVAPWVAFAVTLPLALNPYVLGNSIWVMTDNLSLGLLAIVIGSSVFLAPTPRRLVVVSLAIIGSILVRQINLWSVAGAMLAVIAGAPGIRERLPWHDPLDEDWSLDKLLVITIGIIAGVFTLSWFIWMWGGLVPPTYAEYHAGGINPAVAAYGLTMLAAYALPMSVLFCNELRTRPFVRRRTVMGLLIGLAVGLAFNSAPGIEVGRNGGWLWSLAEALPVIGGRSLLLVLGSAAGGATAGLMFGLAGHAGRSRAGYLLIFFSLSFIAAYTANSQAFQRYFDPPVLLLIGWSLAIAHRENDGVDRRIMLAGLGCAAMQVVFAGWTLYRPLFMNGPAG